MAYSNSLNYYDSTIQDSYAGNISGLIDRIENAHEAIRSKAIEMGLSIPAGKKLTHNAAGTSSLLLTEDHHILDTAAAINNMPVNTHTSLTINAGTTYTVPVGYNKTAYVITASALGGQTSGTAVAADILSGKTAWVNGTKITGTMKNKTGDLTASGFSYYTSNNVNYLYLTIPETGKYEAGKQLKSNIIYNAVKDLEIPVTISVAATGETIVDASKINFAAGYYSGINIKAVYKTGASETNKIINIDNAVGQLTALSGNLVISSGYDYFASNASYSIRSGVISAVTASANADTGIITYGGGSVTTSGWVSSAVTKPATYTPPTAEFTKNTTTGKATVSKAGWVAVDTEIGGLGQGSATMSGPTLNNTGSALTVGSVSVANNNYYMKLSTTAGYISTSTVGIDLKRTVLSNTSLSAAGSGASTITNKYWVVTASAGYNPSALTLNLTVQSGVINGTVTIGTNYAGSLQVTTAGWVNKGTVSLTIPAKDQTYALSSTDLAETDHSFKIDAASGTLMKSLTINTKVIFDRLAAI